MALTPLTVLADLVVDALIALGGTATAKQVIEQIGSMREFTPTEEDLADDPEANRRAWQSRVYTARGHLGDDDLVLASKGRWVLTAQGQAGAEQRVASAAKPAAPPVAHPVSLRPSIIVAPLRDPSARAKVMGSETGDDDPMPVLIELNVSYPGGIAWAYDALKRLFVDTEVIGTGDGMPELFEEYVPADLSLRTIQKLVRADGPEPKLGQRAIYRVWPNFPVHGQIDMSCRTVKADAARRAFNATGEGITWAVIDSGIDASHPHFAAGNTLRAPEVADLHRDFTTSLNPTAETVESALQDSHRDGSGHGTGVASIIAGYLPGDYPAAQLQVMCEQLDTNGVVSQPRVVPSANLSGMAPAARLVSLKVLSDSSNALTVMAALRYVIQVNGDTDKRPRIHGVNLSVGYEFDPQWFACGKSPLCQAVDRLVRSGVVVVVAAGNTGYARFSTGVGGRSGGLTMSINDPGNADRAITVGATHRSDPYTYGVSFFSSKGPTGDGRLKPDLVAPGERITVATAAAPAAPGQPVRLATYADTSGTSFAAPHVSGVAAAFLSVRPEFVSQPERLKQILTASASPLGRERLFEGGGLVDVMRALQSV
jgi:serine protease AprX